jgi:hypothetical protein
MVLDLAPRYPSQLQQQRARDDVLGLVVATTVPSADAQVADASALPLLRALLGAREWRHG